MEHIVIIGNGIVELRLHVIFEKIRFKITIVSSETEFFSFSYRFNVRVYGAHEV
jgi:hypothetical protein